MDENLEFVSFYNYLISKGYFFNSDLIENYLLSIKVKPFTILTGNSGTGKTKLSQLFAKFISDDLNTIEDKENNEGLYSLRVKNNLSSWKSKGWTLPKKPLTNILPLDECGSEFDMLVDGIPAKGDIKVLVQLFYDSPEIEEYLKKKYDENSEGTVVLQLNCNDLKEFFSKDYDYPNGKILLKQKSNQSSYKKRQWFVNNVIFDYYPFDSGFSPCEVIVDGIKSSGKIRATPKLTYKKNNKLQNYLKENKEKEVEVELKIDHFDFEEFDSDWSCTKEKEISIEDENDELYQIIPVGANWTDNSQILGYYNVITEEYQSTPAYDLINKAIENPFKPYFLILDEMNLSHVERYFADFLSAIESGEEIPLGNNEALYLPENLFIIGTVNVDETTYMFSPKVLDRANVIEFDTILASDYMSSNLVLNNFKGDIDYLQSPLVDSDISKLNIDELRKILSNIYDGDKNLWELLAIELNEFQKVLKGSGFEFAFRIINEILRFMVVSWKYEGCPDEWNNWQRYFDAQIKQKILTKLHGSEKAISNILTELFNLCLNNRDNNENPKNFNIDESNCRYYTSALKLKNMSKVLSDQRYVSFIN